MGPGSAAARLAAHPTARPTARLATLPGKMAVLFGQFIFDYGAALSYLIITADTSVEVLKRILGSNFSGMRQLCLGVLSLACMLPLSLLRDIR